MTVLWIYDEFRMVEPIPGNDYIERFTEKGETFEYGEIFMLNVMF